MDRLFEQLVGNVVQYVMFKKETNYLDELGCKRITNSLCALLKTYEQQVTLSYHFINKTTLGETFQENDKYLIM